MVHVVGIAPLYRFSAYDTENSAVSLAKTMRTITCKCPQKSYHGHMTLLMETCYASSKSLFVETLQ